jgi:hypothetical protein
MIKVIQYYLQGYKAKDYHIFYLELENPKHMAFKAWLEDDNMMPTAALAQDMFNFDQKDEENEYGPNWESVAELLQDMFDVSNQQSFSKENNKAQQFYISHVFYDRAEAREHVKKMDYDIVDDWEGHIY